MNDSLLANAGSQDACHPSSISRCSTIRSRGLYAWSFCRSACRASHPVKGTNIAICDVGQVALRDLPVIDGNADYARFYGDAGLRSGNLLTACPDLRRELPAGFRMANDAAMKRARAGFPAPGQTVPRTAIFTVGVPVMSFDGKSAMVEMGYICAVLCGAGFTARYVLESDGWRRDGPFTNTFSD